MTAAGAGGPTAQAAEFDAGPPSGFTELFSRAPAPALPDAFWTDWGPVFYRGRLDGSARVLCLASDPGATERIAGRTLVGDAGQRVQGFLSKLGLDRSYVCLNAYPYALIPERAQDALPTLADPAQRGWRNELYDQIAAAGAPQAIVAFGVNAARALELWTGRPPVPVARVPHPSSHDEQRLVAGWRAAIEDLRSAVTPDTAQGASAPNYGERFTERDYAVIPRRDLPFGAPWFLGDDRWLRSTGGRHGSVTRPRPDDRHTLIWRAPGNASA
jgi:uracil-DNA glycosylase